MLILLRHILTGYATYEFLVWAIYLRHCLKEQQDEFVLSWPSYLSVPEVIPRALAEKSDGFWRSSNGEANGHANGHFSGFTNGYTYEHTNGYTNGHTTGKQNGTNGHIRDRKSV